MSQSVSDVCILLVFFPLQNLLHLHVLVLMFSYLQILEMICECENEAALNIFEQAFELTDEEKEAISRRRISIWTWQNEVSPSLIQNWSVSQRIHFANKWTNDHGLCEESDARSEVIESQTGEGKRPADDGTIESPPK